MNLQPMQRKIAVSRNHRLTEGNLLFFIVLLTGSTPRRVVLIFFCFKKLMKLDLIDSVAMEEVAGFLDKLLSKDKYEGRREANMKYVVE